MKILLINPPTTRKAHFGRDKMRLGLFFPMGLACVVAYIKEKNPRWTVETFDAQLVDGDPPPEKEADGKIRYGADDEEIENRIRAFQPDIVGTSCLFPSAEFDALSVLRLAKKVNPCLTTVMGGVHPTNNAHTILTENDWVDYIVLGEGEVTTNRLFSLLENGDQTAIDELHGLAWRRDGEIVVRRRRDDEYVQNLDTLPWPDHTAFDLAAYLAYGEPHTVVQRRPFTQIMSSRGCPLRCTYCSLRQHWGFRPRFRSAENVVAEIEMLVKTYGIREIHFEDDNFTADKRRVLEIFRLLEEKNLDLTLSCPTGTAVAHLDDELIRAMKKAGFYTISLGIESGDQWVLKDLMKKNVDLEKVPSLITAMRDVGIDTRAFFILGYPGETKASVLRTIDYARSLQVDWTYFFIFTPYPNTPIYDTCIKNGYIEPGDYDKETYNFRHSILKKTDWEAGWLEEQRERAIIECNFQFNPNRLMGNYDKAIADISAVVNTYPHFDFANFYLAETFYTAGNVEMAVHYWRRTLAVNNHHEQARARLKEVPEMST